jgi:hypothetical protein
MLVLILTLLMLLLAACGSQGKPQTTGSRPSGSGTSASSDLPVSQAQHIVCNGDSLHVEGWIECPQYTVLAQNRLTYDAGEIQTIKNYYNPQSGAGQQPQMPSSLAIVSGGPCTASIELTNTGSTPVIVEKVGIQLLTTPHHNTYQYRLIDQCSLFSGCIPGGTGSPACFFHQASVHISGTNVGAVYDSPPSPTFDTVPGGEVCPSQLTIGPSPDETYYLDVDFSADNLIFKSAIELKLITAEGAKTLTLSQFPTTLVFANNDQVSCYALHGTTSMLEYKGAAALANPFTEPIDAHYHNCTFIYR